MDETGLPLAAAHPKSGRGFSSPKLRVSWDCTSIWIGSIYLKIEIVETINATVTGPFLSGYLHVFAMQGLLCLLRKMKNGSEII